MWAQTFQSYDNIYTPVKLFWKTGKPRPLAQPSAVAATPNPLAATVAEPQCPLRVRNKSELELNRVWV